MRVGSVEKLKGNVDSKASLTCGVSLCGLFRNVVKSVVAAKMQSPCFKIELAAKHTHPR